MMHLFERSRFWPYAGVLACALGWPREAAADSRIAAAIAVQPGATCLQAEALAEHVQTWLESNALTEGVSVRVVGSPDDPRVVSFVALRWPGPRRAPLRPRPASCEHLHAAVGARDRHGAQRRALAGRLLSREPTRALALTEDSQRRFPHGYMATERRYVYIMALIALGRRAEASDEAARFFRQVPDGNFSRRIRTALR